MPQNLTTFLTALGVQDIDAVSAALLSDDEQDAHIEAALKQAQSYARPFLESEYSEKAKAERAQYKGKYLKEALLKANKTFGNALTNKEIEDILTDPDNEGKNIDVALDALKEKVSTKSGTPEAELQRMLDTANARLSEYESEIPKIKEAAKREAEETIEKFKLDGVVTRKLMEVLAEKTDNPAKVAELIKGQLSGKAMMRLKEDGNIGLYDLANPETPLKKNDTTLQTFEGLVSDTVDYFGLTKKSNGTQRVALPTETTKTETKVGATGLAAKMAQVAAPAAN